MSFRNHMPAVGDICSITRRVVGEEDDVALAYLFGSAATGRLGPLSDVDLGVLLSGQGAPETTLGRLMDALCRALKTDRVDLVHLNSAPHPLTYRVAKYGKLLKCTDRKLRERFESEAVLRYLDFKPLRERAFETSRQCVLGAA